MRNPEPRPGRWTVPWSRRRARPRRRPRRRRPPVPAAPPRPWRRGRGSLGGAEPGCSERLAGHGQNATQRGAARSSPGRDGWRSRAGPLLPALNTIVGETQRPHCRGRCRPLRRRLARSLSRSRPRGRAPRIDRRSRARGAHLRRARRRRSFRRAATPACAAAAHRTTAATRSCSSLWRA